MTVVAFAADDIVMALSQMQSAEGAFPARVHWDGRHYEDCNGFVTALVLRALHAVKTSQSCTADLERMRTRALTYLSTCKDTQLPGACRFWPPGAQPTWIPEALSADADDTAIYSLELARYGCLDQTSVRNIAYHVLVRHRLRHVDFDWPGPPWLKPGVFRTWLGANASSQIVDCCVNANVVAFLSYTGLTHLPGYREACAMIEAAIRWAGESPARARSLSPFYAHPIELRYAIENAVQCGAKSLSASLTSLEEAPWAIEAPAGPALDRPICSNAYGPVTWTSDAVQLARHANLAARETVNPMC